MATWYRVEHPFAPLGLEVGDIVRYDPGNPWPIEIFRCLAARDGHAFWEALAAGALTRVSSDVSVERLEDVPAPALPAPADVVSRRRAMKVIRAK
jgi:hypothetical protein